MGRTETEKDHIDIQKADELLKGSLETMADIIRTLTPGRNTRLNGGSTWALPESSSDEQISISIRKLRLITIQKGRIVKREDFTTQETPYSTKFLHEHTIWDTSGGIVDQGRTILWQDGIEMTVFRSIADVEESVRRLSEVRDHALAPLQTTTF